MLTSCAQTEYTYGTLIPAIASVETPSTVLVESVKVDEDSSKEPRIEREALITNQKPISTSVCATIRHLRSVGGYFSRFRGAAIYMLHNMVLCYVADFLDLVFPFHSISYFFAFVLVTPLRTLWIHTIVSAPPSTTWWRRLMSIKSVKKAVGATALVAVMDLFASHLAYMLLNSFLEFMDVDNTFSETSLAIMICVAATYTIFKLIVVVPSTAILNRVQVSLLEESEEAIISVDHGEPLGIRQAVERFDLNALRRMYRAYALYVLMQVGIAILFIALFLGEVCLYCGPDFLTKYLSSVVAEILDESS